MACFGVVEILPDGVGPVDALHVRLTITNDGDATPWSITANDQLCDIAGEGRSWPYFVNTDAPGLPTVTVAQRQRRVLDLYSPARTFASRPAFHRVEREPPLTYEHVVLYTGWGPF